MLDSLNESLSNFIQPLGWSGQAIFRMLLSALLGGLVGIEREFRGREAGFRTNILVCVGCTLVMLVSIKFTDMKWDRTGEYQINVDPGRIAYGVMTGIGFLGAGAILKHGTSVRGLTTAAALWCIAAIGLASGMGLYVLAIAASVIVMLVLSLLGMLEQVVPSRHFRKLTFRCSSSGRMRVTKRCATIRSGQRVTSAPTVAITAASQ